MCMVSRQQKTIRSALHNRGSDSSKLLQCNTSGNSDTRSTRSAQTTSHAATIPSGKGVVLLELPPAPCVTAVGLNEIAQRVLRREVCRTTQCSAPMINAANLKQNIRGPDARHAHGSADSTGYQSTSCSCLTNTRSSPRPTGPVPVSTSAVDCSSASSCASRGRRGFQLQIFVKPSFVCACIRVSVERHELRTYEGTFREQNNADFQQSFPVAEAQFPSSSSGGKWSIVGICWLQCKASFRALH